MRRLRILILYYYSHHDPQPPRLSVLDHLYCFRRSSRHAVSYLNVAALGWPVGLDAAAFDVVILHTLLLSQRWHTGLERFRALAQQVRRAPVVLALPQDEFVRTASLDQFLVACGTSVVLSVAPDTEWAKIYPATLRAGARFRRVLTGYISDTTREAAQRLVAPRADHHRTIDIGYRAWKASPWLGRHGLLKQEIATVFQAAAPRWGLSCDISTEASDTLLGGSWLAFLARCKYTIGVEGGATVLDADGSIQECTQRSLADNPDASFEEIERSCFPDRDGDLQLKALSPRHFEAILTRTAQVLVEGDYNGILRPDRHYIPLKADFSNLEAVLGLMRADGLRQQMVQWAFDDIVGGDEWTYQRFVADIDDLVERELPAALPPRNTHPSASLALLDNAGWRLTRTRAALLPLVRRLRGPAKAVLPSRLFRLVGRAVG